MSLSPVEYIERATLVLWGLLLLSPDLLYDLVVMSSQWWATVHFTKSRVHVVCVVVNGGNVRECP